MAFTKPVQGTYEIVFTVGTTGASAWKPFGPCRGRGTAVIASFTGTTNNTSIKVQGSLTSGSTADAFLIAQRKSSAGSNNVQVLSSAGAVAKFMRFVRVFSSGVLNGTTKYARVRVVNVAVSS